MDKYSIITITVAAISCLISIFSYFGTKNKERIEKLDSWREDFNNKVNNFLKFSGTHGILTFKYDVSNCLMLNLNDRNDAEKYNDYIKDLVKQKDLLKSAYQECNSIINISFDQDNLNQIVLEDLINELYKRMDRHYTNVLALNDIREQFFVNMQKEKDVLEHLNVLFNNVRVVILLNCVVEKLKNLTLNAIQLNMINNRNMFGFSVNKMTRWMADTVNSFDEYKYYKNGDLQALNIDFCAWLDHVNSEIESCKGEILGNLKLAKRDYLHSLINR